MNYTEGQKNLISSLLGTKIAPAMDQSAADKLDNILFA